jgi:hypothetical protein
MPEPRPVPRVFPQSEAPQADGEGEGGQQGQALVYDDSTWTSEWRCTQPGGSNVFVVEMTLAGAVGPVK